LRNYQLEKRNVGINQQEFCDAQSPMIQVLNQTFQRKNQVDWGEPVQPDLSTKLGAWRGGAYLPRERAGQLHPGGLSMKECGTKTDSKTMGFHLHFSFHQDQLKSPTLKPADIKRVDHQSPRQGFLHLMGRW